MQQKYTTLIIVRVCLFHKMGTLIQKQKHNFIKKCYKWLIRKIYSCNKLFFPESCLCCGLGNEFLCTDCVLLLPRFGTQNRAQNRIQDRVQNRIRDNISTRALYSYHNKYVQALIYKLKYHGNFAVLNSIKFAWQDFANVQLKKFIEEDYSIFIIPIPLHSSRLKERGFNQAEILAKLLFNNFKNLIVADENSTKKYIYFSNNLLTRIRPTISQTKTANRLIRRENIRGAFKANRRVQRIIEKNNKVVFVIIDDVVTTGATCHEACLALQDSGARNFLILALAQA